MSPVRILATSVFERIVYHCFLVDDHDPLRPVLALDAIVREGDTDGPLLVAVADFKRMLGIERGATLAAAMNERGRIETRDGVDYVTFPIWEEVAAAG